MATVFWNSECILLIDYLPKGTMMNGQYYVIILTQDRETIVQKRRGKLAREVIFLQDNAPVHTAHITKQPLGDTAFLKISHPQSRPSGLYFFSNLK